MNANANEPIEPHGAEQIEYLVKAVQAGQVEHYRGIVLHFQRKLHLYCYHMTGDRAESEDIVQEVFLKAFREIGKYRPTVSFSAWLYKIAYRHCLNSLKRHKGQHRLLSLIKLQWPSAPSPRTAETADHLLTGLSPEDRQLIILRTLEERSFAEIAELTSVNAVALRKKFERIRKKLRNQTRKEILDEGLFPGL
ncbi:RNA polymerase sigma factor [Paenibacillus glycanilyticus]|uniref:RNA polymerase sigma factor n=1 Tax=Paenibacillus glycanilyticus TaxID=126569 RepID=A0ABQ6GHS4_9BACL|nr:sigma-70 family RNA polymerase sigma factor [Paenibacillus glycanilyticus]GLX70424.1 DNA-directed RNA polymerase sigma-70 factor [Paenibacillus glycanilyticus]